MNTGNYGTPGYSNNRMLGKHSEAIDVRQGKNDTARRPTEQQAAIIEAVAGANPAVVVVGIAGAGCGKTSTTRMVADALQKGTKCIYTAFNKSVIEAAKVALPPKKVSCQTMHGAAWGYAKRTGAKDIKGWVASDVLTVLRDREDCKLPHYPHIRLIRKTLRLFCQSADDALSERHVPINEVALAIAAASKSDPPMKVADAVYMARDIAPLLAMDADRLWRKANDPRHWLPLTQEISIKRLGLAHAGLKCDLLMFDECQDVSPVMLGIVKDSIDSGTRVFAVGDPAQAIYGFTGAIDAVPGLCALPGAIRMPLSISWRFGGEIATKANRILRYINGDPLTGAGPPVEEFDESLPYTVLSRSNSALLERAIYLIDRGLTVSIADDLVELAKRYISAAYDLMTTDASTHAELDGMTWVKAQECIDLLEQDMQRAIQLVGKWRSSTPSKLEAIERCSGIDPDEADVYLTTVHKAKGGEWDQCVVLKGFGVVTKDEKGKKRVRADEVRLAYVAITRARVSVTVEDDTVRDMTHGVDVLDWPADPRGEL